MAQGEDLCELSRAKHKDQYLADVKTQGPNDSLSLLPMRNNKRRYLAPHVYYLAARWLLASNLMWRSAMRIWRILQLLLTIRSILYIGSWEHSSNSQKSILIYTFFGNLKRETALFTPLSK